MLTRLTSSFHRPESFDTGKNFFVRVCFLLCNHTVKLEAMSILGYILPGHKINLLTNIILKRGHKILSLTLLKISPFCGHIDILVFSSLENVEFVEVIA